MRRAFKRRRRCPNCTTLFYPHPRTKGKQRFCSKASCQSKRQRLNEEAWLKKNPDCLEYKREQTRKWFQAHPTYSSKRRDRDPDLREHNCAQSQIRMRKIRCRNRFDKTKSILTELVGTKGYRCYLARGGRWLHLRLTKPSRLQSFRFLGNNTPMMKPIKNRLPKGRLYDLSREVFDSS
jgi:hypothetical protein